MNFGEVDEARPADYQINHGVLGVYYIVRMAGAIIGVADNPVRAAAIVTADVARRRRLQEETRRRGCFVLM